MDWLLLICVGLALYLLRDALLLGVQHGGRSRALPLYGGLYLGVFAMLGTAAESISRDQAYTLLRDPRVWIPAALTHIVWWAIILRVNAAAAVAAYVPTPVFVFSAGGAVWFALTNWSWSSGWMAGLATGAVWVAAVVVGAVGLARAGALHPVTVQNFAATANLSALLLIPIQQQASDSSAGVAEQPIDWFVTMLPLALTATMVLLSFLFHRFRSARKAA